MEYWINLFTGKSWDESKVKDRKVTGFSQKRSGFLERIKPGDIFLNYLAGIQRWIGASEVVGISSNKDKIWEGDDYPIRFDVIPRIELEIENAVLMEELKGKVSFYKDEKDKGKYKGIVRGSPNHIDKADGGYILSVLKEHEKNPKNIPWDRTLYSGYKRGFIAERTSLDGKHETIEVSIPEKEEISHVETPKTENEHLKIQYNLLKLGSEMGLSLWIANNDKSKVFDGSPLAEIPNIITKLPISFDEATLKTIELIDVLWLKDKTIVAAFEIESTTSIYSGLLRMSDLISLQPNIDINLFIVAPLSRREKVLQEITRPTFALLHKSMPKICGYISFEDLLEKIKGLKHLNVIKSLKPDFIKGYAEYFESDSE